MNDMMPPTPQSVTHYHQMSHYQIMNLKSDKCFITANAVDAILSVPPQPEPKGKCPVPATAFLTKDDYGEVPEYLQNIKRQLNAEYVYIRNYRERYKEVRDLAP